MYLAMGILFEDTSLRNKSHVFADRVEAGRLLSEKLLKYSDTDAIVLAIPAGGVPVASEIARGTHLAMDLVLVRKVQIPGNPEAGFGAVGPDGDVIINNELLRQLGLTHAEADQQIEKTRKVLDQRNSLFRKGRPFPDIAGKTVILADDGLASGYTMSEAVAFIKKKDPNSIVVAVPTAPRRTVDFIMPEVHEIYCLNVRSLYPFAVAEAYRTWHDVTDNEVLALLKGFVP
jgi:predicted phosphoribosyltransferase